MLTKLEVGCGMDRPKSIVQQKKWKKKKRRQNKIIGHSIDNVSRQFLRYQTSKLDVIRLDAVICDVHRLKGRSRRIAEENQVNRRGSRRSWGRALGRRRWAKDHLMLKISLGKSMKWGRYIRRWTEIGGMNRGTLISIGKK
jgi:hypothetical protein